MVNDQPKWVKSSRCASGTCVEVAKVGDGYLVRDSKNPQQAPLRLTAQGYRDLLDIAVHGSA